AFEKPQLFTPAAVEQLWALNSSATNGALQNTRQIIAKLASGSAAWLFEPALEMLIALMLRDRRDDLALQTIHQVSKRSDFLTALIGALGSSERGDSEILALVAQLVAVGDLTQQDAVDVEIGLLAYWDWRESSLEIMEQLARTIQQHPGITIETEVM